MQTFLSKTTESWCRSIEISVLLVCSSAQTSRIIHLECLYTQKQKQGWLLWISLRDSMKIPRAPSQRQHYKIQYRYYSAYGTAQSPGEDMIWKKYANYEMIDCVRPTDHFKITYCLMRRDTMFGGNCCLCLQVREVICATDHLHPSIIWIIIATERNFWPTK